MAKRKVLVRLDGPEWDDFKAICVQNSTNANAEVRAFIASTVTKANKTQRREAA